jgi:hypothetical protein
VTEKEHGARGFADSVEIADENPAASARKLYSFARHGFADIVRIDSIALREH